MIKGLKECLHFVPSHYSLRNNILAIFGIFILTFPFVTLDIGTGLDAAYFWFFNHYFAYDFSKVLNVFHSFGPFSFLVSPRYQGYNYEIWLIWLFILKAGSIFFFLQLAKINQKPFLPVLILLTIVFLLINPRFLYYTFILPLVLLYLREQRTWFIVPALVICVFTLYVKITLFIFTNALCWSFLAIGFYQNIHRKKAGYLLAGYVLFHLLILFVLYGTPTRIFDQLQAWLGFSFGNSSMYTVTPENSYVLLAGSAISFVLPFILDRKQKSIAYFIAISPLLFLVYKYAFARQDTLHAKAFIYMIVVFSAGYLVSIKKVRPAGMLFFSLSVVLFYLNLYKTDVFYSFSLRNSPGMFWDAFKNYPVQKNTDSIASFEQFRENQLESKLLDSLSGKTVDILPWDLTYVPVNKLNYHPRPMLQTGTLYANRMMDENNATFIRDNGPDAFIWETEKWHGMLGGIDNQYLLNGDPQFWFEVLGRYRVTMNGKHSAVLFRQAENSLQIDSEDKIMNTQWFEWMDISTLSSSDILRALVKTQRNLLGKFVSFFYKEREYYIDYLTREGLVFTHRLGLVNGVGNVWVSPYLMNFNNVFKGYKVNKMRIRHAEPKIFFKPTISYTIQKIQRSKEVEITDSVSEKWFSPAKQCIALNTFDESKPEWTMDTSRFTLVENKTAYEIQSTFESTFRYSPDSIININENTWFYSSVDVYSENMISKDVYLVLQVVDEEGKTVYWQDMSLNYHLNNWMTNGFIMKKPVEITPDHTLVFFVWNPNGQNLRVDNLKLEIFHHLN